MQALHSLRALKPPPLSSQRGRGGECVQESRQAGHPIDRVPLSAKTLSTLSTAVAGDGYSLPFEVLSGR